MHKLLFILFSLSVSTSLSAQSILIGSVEDRELREKQLLGLYDSSVSFTVRPLYQNRKADWKKPQLTTLPLVLTQQYNTHHPYGWNDGAMIASKGYQAMFSAGVHVQYGALEVQVKPEMVYAVNPSFSANAAYGSKMGGGYQKIFPGQSWVKASAGPVSVGLSTQNLWWGPGTRSSLLMSNQAPGFTHVFLASRRPLKTGIGNFEWQVLGGWLQSNKKLAMENANLNALPQNADTRYLNGLVISYNPKWVPGLFLGFTRAVQTYASNEHAPQTGFFEKYLPVLALAFEKKNVANEDRVYRDQLASFFLRWMFPKAHSELYVEYGFNDYGLNTRDYLMSPTHAAAYVAGFKKLIPRTSGRWIDLGFEITQMSQSPDWIVRDAGNWYVHGQIREGYTHQNQILGAGAGFGTNVMSLQATWVNGDKRLGFLLERLDRDPQSHSDKWIDLGLGVLPQWRYRNMLLSGIVELVKTKNYSWEAGHNVLQVHSRLSVQYYFTK